MRPDGPGRTTALLLTAAMLWTAPAARAGEPVRVVVCSSHHHVLRHWLLAAQEGRIPSAEVTVVHFDAHPDMAVPERPLRRAWRAQPGRLATATSIASFQLAAAWVGLVSAVVWLRPRWSHQIPDGIHRFRVGTLANGRLRVDDPNDYYVLDEGWAATSVLADPVPVQLRVLPLTGAAAGGLDAASAAILDIDLDGFATRNPSADRLRAAGFSDAQLDQLRSAFAPDKLRLGTTPEERIAGLERVLGAVSSAANGSWRSRLLAAWTLWRSGLGLRDLWNLAHLLAGPAQDTPLELLLEEGRTLVGVPEFTADPAEVERSAAQLEALLRSGALRPQLVTIARSVRDGFTPEHAWPEIERSTLAALQRGLGPLEVVYDRGLRPAP
jgi:hypothetical protein